MERAEGHGWMKQETLTGILHVDPAALTAGGRLLICRNNPIQVNNCGHTSA